MSAAISAKRKAVFVTGTDTGVGKTLVSVILVSALRRRGLCVRVMKPVETGCGEDLQTRDAELLRTAACDPREMSLIVPYRFSRPVAPGVAESLENRSIDLSYLGEIIDEARIAADVLVIEGAGGLLVPLSGTATWADVLPDWGASVIVIVASRLGAINHSALTFEVLRHRGIPVIGYVLNELLNPRSLVGAQDMDEDQSDALLTNRAAVRRIASSYGIAEIGIIPRFDRENAISEAFAFSEAEEGRRIARAVIDSEELGS